MQSKYLNVTVIKTYQNNDTKVQVVRKEEVTD